MTPLDFEFAPERRMALWPWAILIVMTLATIAALSYGSWLEAQHSALLSAQDGLRDPLDPALGGASASEAGADSEGRSGLATDWPLVLDELEAVAVDGITVKSLELRMNDGQARVDVVFVDYLGLTEYLRRLNDSAGQVRWHLVHAQASQPGSTEPATARLSRTLRR